MINAIYGHELVKNYTTISITPWQESPQDVTRDCAGKVALEQKPSYIRAETISLSSAIWGEKKGGIKVDVIICPK